MALLLGVLLGALLALAVGVLAVWRQQARAARTERRRDPDRS
jgi:hypothetical protein